MSTEVVYNAQNTKASACLDLATGQVGIYSPFPPYYEGREPDKEAQQRFHDCFGGRRTYQSRSGLTWEGIIPSRPGLVELQFLWTSRPLNCRYGLGSEVLPNIYGLVTEGGTLSLTTPAEGSDVYGRRNEFVVLFLESDSSRKVQQALQLFSIRDWAGLKEAFGAPKEYHIEWYDDCGYKKSCSVNFYGKPGYYDQCSARWLLSRMFAKRLKDVCDTFEDGRYGNAWHRGLGIRLLKDGRPYHVGQGFAWAPAELSREHLTKRCSWATFPFTDTLDYIVEGEDGPGSWQLILENGYDIRIPKEEMLATIQGIETDWLKTVRHDAEAWVAEQAAEREARAAAQAAEEAAECGYIIDEEGDS